MSETRIWKCKQCGHEEIGNSPSCLIPHCRAVHDMQNKRGPSNSAGPKLELSPYDNIKNLEKQIHSEILKLDSERNRLQDRIREIDNIISKYKKI